MYAIGVLEVEQGSSTPMVFTATEQMASECKRYHSRLAELLSNKKGEDYSTTISWIRVSLNRPPEVCAVSNLCQRGSRCMRRAPLNITDNDFAIYKELARF